MKKILTALIGCILLSGCALSDSSQIWDKIYEHEKRIVALEKLCNELNSNIKGLGSISSAGAKGDYIKSITPVVQDGMQIGYTIVFAQAGNITIYHGKNGADGENGKDGLNGADGKDGQDGYTPIIGVRKDTDGIYYWTLDGEWLLGDNGEKISAQGLKGEDGKDGQDGEDGKDGEKGDKGDKGDKGEDGKDGQDGKNGQDGITPQLKIEEDYWYISYDNGESWKQLGKAKGEDGEKGDKGEDGADGTGADSYFENVWFDDDNMYFLLAGGVTEITVPREKPLMVVFESETVKVDPYSVINLGYLVECNAEEVEVEVVSSADINARVIPVDDTNKEGTIYIQTGAAVDEFSKVVVFISDGSKVIMKRITFVESSVVIEANDLKEVALEGGTVELEHWSASQVYCEIPEEATSWITAAPATKAMESYSIAFDVHPNDTGKSRYAEISIYNETGTIDLVYIIAQLIEGDDPFEEDEEGDDEEEELSEREILSIIYDALGGENWRTSYGWNVEDSLENWEGVYLDENGSVEMIVLYNNELSGYLPPEIAQLENLMLLDVSNNDLEGDIPQEIIESEFFKYTWGHILVGNDFNEFEQDIDGPYFNVVDNNGNTLNSEEIYSTNEYTILINAQASDTNFGQGINSVVQSIKKYSGIKAILFTSGGMEDNNDYIASAQYYNTVVLSEVTENLIGDKYKYPFYPEDNHTGESRFTIIDREGKVVYSNITSDLNVSGFFADELENAYISSDFSKDGEVVTLQSASEGDGIDIVIMGDGFSDRNIEDGTYEAYMKKAYDAIFLEEPYKSFKHLFDVSYVNVVSNTEGYDYGDTALKGYFDEGTSVGGDDDKVWYYAQKVIPDANQDITTIIVVMNREYYAGTCYMYSPRYDASIPGNGLSISYFPLGNEGDGEGYPGKTFADILNHEACGHGFSKLNDEYYYEEKGTIPEERVNEIQEYQNNYGWYLNVDFTDSEEDILWAKFLADERYAYDGLGVFEGACTYRYGAYRPTENSIMFHNTEGFNAPSREAIYIRIHKLAYGNSWEYDYKTFVEYDSINRKTEEEMLSAPVYNYVEMPFEPLGRPVIITEPLGN